MPGVTGVAFIIAVNTGTEGSPVYTDIGGQRSASLSLNLGESDVTSKDSANWSESLPTIRDWSVDFDGLLLEADAGYAELEDKFFNRTALQVRLTTAAANTYIGLCNLSSLSQDAPHDGEASISGSLKGTGPLVKA